MEAESESSWLLRLPEEILEYILDSECLSCLDICRVSQVCSYLRDTCQQERLWRQKLRQRWPHATIRVNPEPYSTWAKDFRQRHLYARCVHNELAEMAMRYYEMAEMSVKEFVCEDHHGDVVDKEEYYRAVYRIDELKSIALRHVPGENLTRKYYATKLLRHLLRKKLIPKLLDHFDLPEVEQKMEEAAVLYSRWCKPFEEVSGTRVRDQLDNIAVCVKRTLQETHPLHPVLTTQFNEGTVTCDLWNKDQCAIVLRTMNIVMFTELRFHEHKYTNFDPIDSYIDSVLDFKGGIAIVLCIIYQAVARRLGVMLEPANLPYLFMLRWRRNPLLAAESRYLFINVVKGGIFLDFDELPLATGARPDQINIHHICCGKFEVFQRLIRNMIVVARRQYSDGLLYLHSALHLSLIVDTENVMERRSTVKYELGRSPHQPTMRKFGREMTGVIDRLEVPDEETFNSKGLMPYMRLSSASQLHSHTEKTEVKGRTNASPAFSVGLIMQHKCINYYCVIVGWDIKCRASLTSIIQNHPEGCRQPCYQVLAGDGTTRYVEQYLPMQVTSGHGGPVYDILKANLALCRNPEPIEHSQIGRFFEYYAGNHYIMNTQHAKCYPDDAEYTRKLLQRKTSGASNGEECNSGQDITDGEEGSKGHDLPNGGEGSGGGDIQDGGECSGSGDIPEGRLESSGDETEEEYGEIPEKQKTSKKVSKVKQFFCFK